MRDRCGCEIRRRRIATYKHDKVRQEARTAKKRNYLRALKARRDIDADAVTRSLQGAKIYAKKQARAYNDGR